MKIDQPASLSPRREAHFSCLPGAGRQGHRQQGFMLAVGAMLIAAALVGCSKPEAEQKGPLKSEPKVGVVTLQSQSQQLDASLPGRTRAFLTAEVRPQVSGIIQQRLFTEGALVKQGQQLYQIDPATYQASYESAKGDLAKAQAAAKIAQLTLNRYQKLLGTKYISQQDYDTALADAQQANAAVLAAKLGLDRQWLHAVELSFTHPSTAEWVTFTSPYPADLDAALQAVASE